MHVMVHAVKTRLHGRPCHSPSPSSNDNNCVIPPTFVVLRVDVVRVDVVTSHVDDVMMVGVMHVDVDVAVPALLTVHVLMRRAVMGERKEEEEQEGGREDEMEEERRDELGATDRAGGYLKQHVNVIINIRNNRKTSMCMHACYTDHECTKHKLYHVS